MSKKAEQAQTDVDEWIEKYHYISNSPTEIIDVKDLREYLQGKQVIDTETHVAVPREPDGKIKNAIQEEFAKEYDWMGLPLLSVCENVYKAMLKASEEDA